MSHTYSPYPPNFEQKYQQQQIPQYQQPSGYPQFNQYQNTPQYDAQSRPSIATPPQNSFQAPQTYQQQHNQYSPSQLPQIPQHGSASHSHSPFPSQAAPFAHQPQNSTARTSSPASQFIPNGYQTGTPPFQLSSSVPPMGQHSTFSQNSAQSTTTASPTRRPLPTPGVAARPVTQPPLSRRPLPDPQGSSFSPPSQSRHRPSHSVSPIQTSSGFSTHSNDTRQTPEQADSRLPRPLPHPIPRSTKSLDLTRSASPSKDAIITQTGPLPLPGQRFIPHWKRMLPSMPPHPSSEPPSVMSSKFAQHPGNGTPLRPLPSPGQQSASPSNSVLQPPPRPGTFTRAHSTDESNAAFPSMNSIPLRDRSRTLPHALPPPSTALPRRPDTGIAASQSMMNGYAQMAAESPISSESEDLNDNALLHRPLPPRSSPMIVPPVRAPSPPPATRSRFIERSAEPGPMPTRTRRLSLVSRMAEMSMHEGVGLPPGTSKSVSPGSSPSKGSHPMQPVGRASTQPSVPRWPAELPPLPRAPQSLSDAGGHSRQGSASRSNPPLQHPDQQASPTRPQFAQTSQEGNTSPRFPPPPQHPASPSRSRFPSDSESRGPSPSHSQPPPLPPRSHPTSPTRPRFPRQAPEREPALPAPRAQRLFPNLDDAPPPSLRRTPSPSPQRSSTLPAEITPRHTCYNAAQGLPNIRTHNMPPTSHVVPQPSVVTPGSASSVFSLSAFPFPPDSRSANTNTSRSGFSPMQRLGSGMPSSPNRPGSYKVSFPASPDDDELEYVDPPSVPNITVSGPNTPTKSRHNSPNGVPQIAINGMDEDDETFGVPMISVGGVDERSGDSMTRVKRWQQDLGPLPSERSKNGLFCGGCGGTIIGRAVYTTDASWHPACLKCTACGALLENLAVCEYEGRPYCSLDYYENFAPRCHHCQTAIADHNYITLKDEQLGERTYHEQHFFCAECGDPFLPPSTKPRSFAGEGAFDADEGFQFIVYQGHPYCEDCHVRLRMPKCKKCNKSLRLDDDKLEFMGAKYCPDCFVCKGCDGPFVNGQLFVRDKKPFCRRCYDIIVKSEL